MVLVQSFHKLSVVALITCATGCGLDAAYAAFTTSTTSTGSTGSTGEPGSTGSTGGDDGLDTSSGEGSEGMSGSSSGNEIDSGSSSGSTGTTAPPDPYCGDGTRDSGEECDPLEGGKAGKSCNEHCFRDRLVFVTSEKFTGSMLMGLVGADNACNELAEAAGVYAEDMAIAPMRAWLSGADFDAGTRILFGEGQYVRRDGKVVVESATDLVSGHLQAAIEIDEWGELVNAAVWTNTRADGTAISKVETCGDWTSDDEPAVSHVGGSPATDLSWTHAQAGINPQSCELDFRLYCFEERGAP